jgi:hypothetical protein
MKKKLVLKKILISNLNPQKLLGGTGNSLDDETNSISIIEGCNTINYPNDCSAEPWKCMLKPPTHP